jgi:hypothetical protein
MEKLKCVFIGNCQNNALIHFLNKNNEFREKYNVINYTNYQLIRDNISIPVEDIKTVDVVILQPLPPVHGCYSTDPSVKDSIGYFINDKCTKITYPYVYLSSFWPIIQAGYDENRWFGNEVIDKLFDKGYSANDIIELYKNNKIDWEYTNRFKESINILKQKESVTDVKISEFIESNLTNELLFLIPQHPTSIVFLEMTNQILKILNLEPLSSNVINGVNDAGLPDSTYHIPSNRFPIHKSIINDLNLTYADEYIENSEDFYLNRILTYITMNKY